MEEYDIIEPPIDGFSAVKKDGKWGFLDKYDLEIIPCVYEGSGKVFSCGLASVKKNGKWGFIDECNHPVIPFVYDNASNFCNETAFVTQKGRKFCINTKGEEIARKSYSRAIAVLMSLLFLLSFGLYSHFSPSNTKGGTTVGGFQRMEQNGKVGYRDKNDKMVVPFEYDDGKSVQNGKVWVLKGRLWGQVTMENKVHIPFKYQAVQRFKEGFALVQENYRWFFIREGGSLLTPFVFEHANSFSEGLAAVKWAGFWGYINTKGLIVIQPKFSNATNFNNGAAKVTKDGKQFYIDRNGSCVKNCRF